MHVGALQLFTPPDGAGPEFPREAYDAMLECTDVQSMFRKHPAYFGGIRNVAWTFDKEVELDYHLRQSALPRPGRVRELLELTSRLHSSPLDRRRPLWEGHLVEGLADGRYAVYMKFHHSLLDGVSALRLLQRLFTPDPNDREVRVPWNLEPPQSKKSEPRPSALRRVRDRVESIAGLAPSTLKLARAALLEQQLTLPFRAPHTMFNVPIGAARRVAGQSWSLDRIRRVKSAAGVTVNDVVLAMSGGALRAYLQEQNALPDAPLVAMVPVNLRTEKDTYSGGNIVGTFLCNLATDTDDPMRRLQAINTSMDDNKKVFAGLSQVQQLALSAVISGGIVTALLPGYLRAGPPPFNIVISNVPGPREPMYWRGARMDGNYPLSIAFDGQALNITLTNNADNLDFGLVGCRRSVPHMQRLLLHLEASLTDLEGAVGV
jgi:WS/DGAT/MGAT family acyltransferase